MKKQKSFIGLLIYFIIGIIALFFAYLHFSSTLSTNPTQFEQMSKMLGVSASPEKLAFLTIINPFIQFIVMLLIGFFVAHRVGLKSVIIHPWARGISKSVWIKGAKQAVILGMIAGIALISFDLLFRSYLPSSLIENIQPYTALQLIVSLLYGGIIEEILIRFGLMSLIVLVLWKIFDRKSAKPSSWIFIIAITISALLFALGHYGANAILTEMTPFIWFRMIFINGIGGLFFGWIYWKYNLELAMLSHMFAHITMSLLLLVLTMFM
jgi:membrane protease YdiL (CAAX protease family)